MTVSVPVPSAHAAPSTQTFSYTGPAVPIPDAGDLSGTLPGAPATATVTSSGFSGAITDIDFRIDGSACTATVGDTNAGIDHSFVNDLVVTLTAPDGTSVVVINHADGGGNNLCQTVLDDEGANPIQAVTTAEAPFTGTFTPANPLSAFDGGDPNGIWTVSVQDFFSQDTGSLRAFSVIVTAEPTADVSATKTVAGDFSEGGAVSYTVTSTNAGNTAAPDNAGAEFTDVLPAGLTLVSATATSGTAVATPATNTVTWDGAIPAGGSVTITINATVAAGTQNQAISNQGTVSFDSDVDGTNDTQRLTDDPALGGAEDPTTFTVGDIIPTVTIVQAISQTDPTTVQPVHFTATFSEPVTGFDGSDVLITGAAGATTAVVSGAGPVYDVAVSGAPGLGTITVAIPAGAAIDNTQTPNLASTSSDDTVTLEAVPATTTTVAPTVPPTTAPATTTPGAIAPAPTTTAPRGLPATGSGTSGSTALAALALLLAGGGLVLTARRRVAPRR